MLRWSLAECTLTAAAVAVTAPPITVSADSEPLDDDADAEPAEPADPAAAAFLLARCACLVCAFSPAASCARVLTTVAACGGGASGDETRRIALRLAAQGL